jgi:quercetin dioxygenase-like cupin family protein
LLLWFVLDGEVDVLRQELARERLGRGDAVAVPAGVEHVVVTGESGCELLEVTVPAQLVDLGVDGPGGFGEREHPVRGTEVTTPRFDL